MVLLPNPGNLRPGSVSPEAAAAAAAANFNIDDSWDEVYGPVKKRYKMMAAPFQQGNHYNLLDGPSTLGLRLRKSPSLLGLVQTAFSLTNSGPGKRKALKPSDTTEKQKASNFPVSLLRIGSWEWVSRYSGDLVVKCYFGEHILVWEVLDGGLKSKIEIQWSDITGLKITCHGNGLETLDIVVSRPPLFFKETDLEPRKQTSWAASSDFTGGQASMHRRHFLQCSQGLLSRHFEKVIQSDRRLYLLSQQPQLIVEPPYFGTGCPVFDAGLQSPRWPCAAAAPSTMIEAMDPASMGLNLPARYTPSPSSAVFDHAIEGTDSDEAEVSKIQRESDHLKVLDSSEFMSMSGLVNHVGHSFSVRTASGDPLLSGGGLPSKDVLDELEECPLGDEQRPITRADSLCCVPQKDAAAVQDQSIRDCDGPIRYDDGADDQPRSTAPAASVDCAQPCGNMPRNDSHGDLLGNLSPIGLPLWKLLLDTL